MWKKIIAKILLILFLLQNWIALSSEGLIETHLYYSDVNQNGKIDTLEIEFNHSLTGNINFSKLFLYSNTGWLWNSYLNSISWNSIFSGSSLSWNILKVDMVEQDNFLTGLIINNTTSSHLRLKTNAGVWIFDEFWNEIKLLYTSSFSNYNNVSFKENIIENIQIETQTGNIIQTWSEITSIISTWWIEDGSQIVSNSGSENNSNTGTIIASWSENNSSWMIHTGSIVYPNFSSKIIFQNPTYLSGKEIENNEYTCLDSETDCKVNYNLNINTWSWFEIVNTSKYNCEWDFWLWEFVEEKYKCNPNTITYGEWTFETTYQITEIWNPDNTFQKKIKIINSGYIKPASEIQTVYRSYTNTITYMFIDTPKIIIQSWLDENNNCVKDDCSLNLKYEVKNSREACLWFFPGWSFDPGTDKKCNPGYIKYPLWEFKATLRVYESGNESNYKESFITFKNNPQAFQKINSEEVIKETGNKPVAKITLEWTIGKDKKVFNNYLTCFWKDCSVNLNGDKSYSLDKLDLTYWWDFWNGETGTGVNPKSIIYTWWEYRITLKITDENGWVDEDEFFVKVWEIKENQIQKEKNQTENSIPEKKTFQISKVFPNPTGIDYAEYIEITNIGTWNQNLNDCEIDDKIWWASKPYKIEKDMILYPQKSIKFFKFDTEISLNNSGWEEVNLICDNILIESLKWNFQTPDNFIVDHNVVNIQSQKIKILNAIDGDTFLVEIEWKKYFLRLIGIDTPETKHPQKEIQKYGIEAYHFAKNLDGKEVYLIIDTKNFLDTYGRLLWYIKVSNEKTFNEMLLENGYSKIYDRYDFEMKEKFQKAENIGKEKKLWLWSETQIDFEKIDLKEKSFEIEKIENITEEIKKELETEKNVKIKDILTQNTENNFWEFQSWIVIKTPEKITEILNKTFTQKIKKQKSWIKIYGKTYPNTKIILELNIVKETSFFFLKAFADNNYYETLSDDNGDYELVVNTLNLWEFEVKTYLKVDEKNAIKLDAISSFDVDKDYLEYINFSKNKEEIFSKKQEKTEEKIQAHITLQKSAKNIWVSENKIICKNMESCHINFDGRDSSGDIRTYMWNFWNGETSSISNPKSILFETGKYIVSLKVWDNYDESISYFIVEVTWKIIPPQKVKKPTDIPKTKNIIFKQQKLDIVPTVYGNNEENKDIQKPITLSIFVLLVFFVWSFILLKRQKIL